MSLRLPRCCSQFLRAACWTAVAAIVTACGGGGGGGGGSSGLPAASTPPPAQAPAPAQPPAPPARPPYSTIPTAGPGVSVYPIRLAMPGLDRTRGLRIYVPPDYATSSKRYPVIYMHDAQNLFDDATSQAGEWHVDESLDELAREGKLEAIVVGIDRGGEVGHLWEDELRGHELMPFADTPMTNGRSDSKQYMNFIVNVVKPLIDQEYRTLPDRANTAIGGASLGGIISYYGINEYPDVFGRALIFSASFAFGGAEAYQYEFVDKVPPKDARLYFYIGGAEDPTFVQATRDVYGRQLQTGHQADAITLSIVPGAQHGEQAFSAEFKKAVAWLFAQPLAGDAPSP